VIDEAGTPLYASPEIYSGISDAFNFNCDVWGAGMILHEMLTGTHPLGHIHVIFSIYRLKDS
jgi:serine/threonine protein kinase